MRLSGYTSTRSISSSVVSVSALKIALDASLLPSCRTCSSCFTLLFEIFIELLKICTGSNIEKADQRPLSPAMRAEVRKLDQYLEEYKLLCDRHIESPKELLSFQEGLTTRISELEERRYALRLKLRRVKSPEEEAALKERCKEITKEITPLRRERKTILRIAEHIPKIQELLDAERKTEMEHNHLTQKKERKVER